MVPVGEAGSISWVCGEVATVEVEIRNPTVIPIKVGGCGTHLFAIYPSAAFPKSVMRGVMACGAMSLPGGAFDAGGGVGWAPFRGAARPDGLPAGRLEAQPSRHVAST